MRTLITLLFVVALSINSFASSWRTDGNGSYPNAKVTTIWSADDNVVWKVPLPKWSNASPVIEGDKIFVCAEPDILICLSKKDGSELWRAQHTYESFLSDDDQAKSKEAAPRMKELGPQIKKLEKQLRAFRKIKDSAERKEKEAPIRKKVDHLKKELAELKKFAPPSTHSGTGYSTPTPACDGKNVFVVFGNGIAACHTIDGKKKWAKQLGRPTHGWGHSGSPAIVGDKAIAQISDVVAYNLETGDEVWKVPGKHAFGSLVHTKVDGKDLIVTAEGKVIAADDGKVLAEGLSKLDYCSPIVVDGIAYFIQNGGKAFKLTAEEGKKPKELWKTEPKKDRYYGSPVLHDGLIYAVTQKGEFSVIDAKDGKVVHNTKLGTKGTHYTSPTFAGGYILIGTENGEMAILKAGKEPEKVAVNKLEKFRTTPVFEGSRMYLRGVDHLYCIGQ